GSAYGPGGGGEPRRGVATGGADLQDGPGPGGQRQDMKKAAYLRRDLAQPFATGNAPLALQRVLALEFFENGAGSIVDHVEGRGSGVTA
ncbi:MAG: hypothetical protein V3R16_04100, partial [Nitrospirales bacterium]